MTVLAGLIYVIYFILLGIGARIAFNLLIRNQLILSAKTDLIAHAFFQGIFIHLLIFNTLQYINFSVDGLLIFITALTLICAALVIWQYRHGIKHDPIAPHNYKHSMAVILLVSVGSYFIYHNGHMLPNIAWDSWAVWEGKAQQWVNHGLNAQIVRWGQWLDNEQALFNQAANYPDGLSLLYYLPNLIVNQAFAVTHVVYLFAFAMITVLLVNKAANNQASIYLQCFKVLSVYTTPMIGNHLMIQGYADIWLAMYLLLIMLTLIEYKESGNPGMGLSLLCYLAVLPMLKLEGWVWLVLFTCSYWAVKLWQKQEKHWTLGFMLMVSIVIISGVINFSLPWGELIISHDRVVIFNLIDTPIQFVNITEQLMVSFLWQNNWALIWLGLPFLIVTFFTQRHSQANQVAQVFFIAALLCFLFLFYFTEASQWALDLTAINRLVLQLTPCYLFLLFRMLTQIEQPNFKTQD